MEVSSIGKILEKIFKIYVDEVNEIDEAISIF
jgi:hypothetical protein